MKLRKLARQLAIIALGIIVSACSTTYPRRVPSGETFPNVRGNSLDGSAHRLPADLLGEPALLLIGYKQNTQFDLDRWLLGLTQAEAAVRVYELPTIPGMLPGLFAGKIDSGMRSGIPSEDWASVITVYKDGDDIARFTGNENPLPGRIVLLDADGRVAFFHDRGYSVGALTQMLDTLEALKTNAPVSQRDPSK